MRIEKVEESQIGQIVEMEKKCFKQPWNIDQCLYELKENPFSTIYWIKEEEVVGYAFLWVTFEIAQLARIGIDPAFRKKGYGKKLLQELMRIAREQGCEFMSLEVRESNLAAIKLYESLSFVQVNVSKNYYPDGENAIVFSGAL